MIDSPSGEGHREGCHLAHIPYKLSSCGCNQDPREIGAQMEALERSGAVFIREGHREWCSRKAFSPCTCERRGGERRMFTERRSNGMYPAFASRGYENAPGPSNRRRTDRRTSEVGT